ncbi:MAG TPA: hypothetical protein VFS60_15475 [Thermoanaerobaculia bacterium]|nr:hypothetical protein [Thermoanaerobaculia bacterium]
MAFAYPSQRLQDWLSQQWVIALGRRIEPAAMPWLAAPYGMVDTIGDSYLERLAASEGLAIERAARRRRDDGGGEEAGLFHIDKLGLDAVSAARLHPEIAAFYQRTTAFELEMWVLWSPWFWAGGNLLRRLYSRRLQQLNLPMGARETSRGLRSEIIRLRAAPAGEVRHTIWYRVLKSSGEALYSGLYGLVDLPSGERCLKIVFPLPRGNATEIFRVAVGPEGDFLLDTEGRRFGDPGFYFQLVDGRGQHHAQHIPSFRDRLRVYVDEDGVLRADQVFTLWGRTVVELRYRMLRRRG